MTADIFQDDDNYVPLIAVIAGAVLTTVAVVVGVAMNDGGKAPAAATAAPAAAVSPEPAPAAAPAQTAAADEPRVVVEAEVVKFYFATGRSDLAPGAAQALQQAVAAAKGGAHLRVSGYHDATGSAAKNAELAKQRALAVRQALLDQGVPEGNIELVKPAELVGATDPAEARRVDVIVIKSGQ